MALLDTSFSGQSRTYQIPVFGKCIKGQRNMGFTTLRVAIDM